MNLNDFDEGMIVDLEVVKEKCRQKFFRVRTDDGSEFDIQRFKFQYGQPAPSSLPCFIKQTRPSLIISQDLSSYIKNFYEVGKDYEFRVKTIKREPQLQYIFEDDKGLCFNFVNPSLHLNKGEMIKCRVTNINDVKVNLKYIGTLSPKFPLTFMSIEDWFKALKVNASPSYYLRLIKKIPEFQPIVDKYIEKDPTWILDILNECTSHLPQWLIKSKDKLPLLARINRKVDMAKRVSLYILEESDYLRNCNQNQRTAIQAKLSNCVELFEQYLLATSKILENKHESFIDNMFLHLKEAGYLYKPDRQIRIMMTILKLRPDLINSRMGELFETLHSWDITNWQSEPFREALVQQLQIFIEENYTKANLMAANDSSSDNRIISRLILALAVQRLLTADKDDIDMDLNRSILYRYNSYRMPHEVNQLLQKAYYSILGIDIPNEISWKDTNNPILLFNKLASPYPEPDETLAAKTYSTSKVDIQIRKEGVHIIAKDADPDTTIIPNNFFDWLSPVISLADDHQVKTGKKIKNLKDLKEFWNSVLWSIYGYEENIAEQTAIEKRRPGLNDEVRIIIDGLRINPDVNDKQRLQFHCKIVDDLFFGEGWMPCDAYHMVGWMTENNFDGSLKFANDESGTPLLYKAKVTKTDKELGFSIKNEISDYLLDSNYTGQETIAVVTAYDKTSKAFICLSENGASYKIPDTSNNLKLGQIIRITYIEPDRSNLNSQYFIGGLSENQEDLPLSFNKNDALFNLMQMIGEPQPEEDDFQVVESHQIMTQEELIELALLFQRRASSESEFEKAYNLLGLASILAKASEDKKLLENLKNQMSLLELLQEFGKNKKLDPVDLEPFENVIKTAPNLEQLFIRLKIVSDIDVNENAALLWEIKKNPRNETEGQLASLVLSYNFLPEELEAPRQQIMNQITSLIDVNSTEITSKYYGVESQTTEFKSSLVYSPKKGSRPAPKEQIWEITHIICGFMNARGGKLYIGVNDAGYENGLNDDIAYRKQHGHKPTIDGMIVDLQNHLDRVLPPHAKDHFHIYEDSESKKGVIIVEILPVRQPVEFEGKIYVRTSSVTKPRNDEERESFIQNRAHNYDTLLKLWGAENSSETDTAQIPKEPDQEASSAETLGIMDNREDVPETTSSTDSKIKTGLHRKNVLHYYEDYYVEPAFYLYFNDDNTLQVTDVDNYRETDDDCLLVLAVKEKEKFDNLIMTDNNQEIKVLSIEDLGKNPSVQALPLSGNKLNFANIGSKNDYLLSVIKASNNSLFYRIDSISGMPVNEDLKNAGIKLCDNPYTIITQDIVRQDELSLFDPDSVDRDSKIYGVPVPVGDGTLSQDERVSRLLEPLIAKE